ncbi:ThiF family adenylyltransferase [Rhizobium sp. YS-1r]|uniref:ThiF family adenylyltransferase n=1 Tax=Rhizobium sp. YS-1r TaxID=1532558 RepID=UPI00050D91A5|nr:ThiF family adenylyltransferase [Rhizobium sp. YS-1r]KGD87652.1 hypothetical protein JL39_25765 [Rhizobium sp. YS-1r]
MTEIDRRDLLILTAGTTLGLVSAGPAMAQTQPFDITAAMHGLKGISIPEQITVLGTGGSGCWPAVFAAMCGVKEMLLIDASDVSADDLGRTCFRPSDIGRPKSEATADIVKIFRPETQIKTIKRFVNPGDNDIYFGTVLFDGVDYVPLNKALPEEAAKRNMKYVQGFYKGLYAGVTSKYFETEWTKGGDGPVWPPSAALSGILQIYAVFAAPFNFTGNPANLHMPDEVMAAAFVNGSSRPTK